MNELQPDQSYGLSYDENLFLSCQKAPNVKFKGGRSLLIRRL